MLEGLPLAVVLVLVILHGELVKVDRIDRIDGAAPASADAPPSSGTSGLEGLAGTPQRMQSPATGTAPASSMDDMMGLFGSNGMQPQSQANDMMNGFAGLDLGGASQPPPPQTQLQDSKKTNEDLLSLF